MSALTRCPSKVDCTPVYSLYIIVFGNAGTATCVKISMAQIFLAKEHIYFAFWVLGVGVLEFDGLRRA